jgi:acetylglutamate kinase
MDVRKKLREVSRKAVLLDRLDKLMAKRRGREHEKGKKSVVTDREEIEFLHKAIATANKRAATQTRKAGRRKRRAVYSRK